MRIVLENLEWVSLNTSMSLSGRICFYISVSKFTILCIYVYVKIYIFPVISMITMLFTHMCHQYDYPFNFSVPFIASISTEQTFPHSVPVISYKLKHSQKPSKSSMKCKSSQRTPRLYLRTSFIFLYQMQHVISFNLQDLIVVPPMLFSLVSSDL